MKTPKHKFSFSARSNGDNIEVFIKNKKATEVEKMVVKSIVNFRNENL